jgi:hypothetical protein
MSYTETTSEGFFSRLGNSIVGIFVGFLIILASSYLLYWNEGNYVRTATGLTEGKGAVQEISPDKVDPAKNGKLVHVTGTSKANSLVKDDAFGVSVKALRLRRHVQFFEWVEKKESKKRKKLGGGEETVTTYTYEEKWVDEHSDSSQFKEKGHTNPTPPAIENKDFDAGDATLGAFKLAGPVMEELNRFEKLPLGNFRPSNPKFRAEEDVLFRGKYLATPHVGDVKIDYQVVKPGLLSLVAKQTGNGFDNYATHSKTNILLAEFGSHPAEQMFQHAEEANTVFTWALRLVGWVLMCIGFSMLVGPITIVADIIPILGDLVGVGTAFFGFTMGTSLSLVCIAVGWIFARPLVGGLMLAAAIATFVMLKKAGKR